MNATQHPSNNRVLGAPQGWRQGDAPCRALAITETQVDGLNVMASFWRPTAEELAQLAAGGVVSLWIVGAEHPVVALDVEPAM